MGTLPYTFGIRCQTPLEYVRSSLSVRRKSQRSGSIEKDRAVRSLPVLLAAVAVVMFLFAFFYRNQAEGEPGHVIGAVAWYGFWISVAAFALWVIWRGLESVRRRPHSR